MIWTCPPTALLTSVPTSSLTWMNLNPQWNKLVRLIGHRIIRHVHEGITKPRDLDASTKASEEGHGEEAANVDEDNRIKDEELERLWTRQRDRTSDSRDCYPLGNTSYECSCIGNGHSLLYWPYDGRASKGYVNWRSKNRVKCCWRWSRNPFVQAGRRNHHGYYLTRKNELSDQRERRNHY